jgi:hypothetical protein
LQVLTQSLPGQDQPYSRNPQRFIDRSSKLRNAASRVADRRRSPDSFSLQPATGNIHPSARPAAVFFRGFQIVAEHEVMWIGRRPRRCPPSNIPRRAKNSLPPSPEACSAAGCEVQDYIAAAGAYGSWMIRFSRDDARQRLVWNGKEGRLLLEQASTGIDWNELQSCAVAARDAGGFVAAVQGLLRKPA